MSSKNAALARPELDAADMLGMTAETFDALPFGVIRLDGDGRVVDYNAAESKFAKRAKEQVVGKLFFRDVAPCAQGADFEGRLQTLLSANTERSEAFDYDFRFPWGARSVRIRLLVDKKHNVWVFVTLLT